ncbi:hypothetical protein [Marilutibacter maris]|uniref:hypothetical protein n=1 Tax=Marilutibacter maris TaxID=1605891 RepID=UPI0011AE67E7|nr:hypothetical protein [Lysobacter maris]
MSGFASSRWSLVVNGGGHPRQARTALVAICQDYRCTVLGHLRGLGCGDDEAGDLARDFFAWLLAPGAAGVAACAPDRFRPFLRDALARFLDDRGAAPSTRASPTAAFDHAWALAVLRNAGRALEREYRAEGRERLHETLIGLLVPVYGNGGEPVADALAHRLVAAARLGTDVDGVATQLARMHRRLRELILAELSQTVCDSAGLEAEYALLLRELGALYRDDA